MKVNETINVPLWELKEIANTLRMVANALDCPKKTIMFGSECNAFME